jgi:hypothetical protein
MFGEPFYHSTIRKTVIAFGSLFNNVYVTRSQNDEKIKIKIPIIYSTKENFFHRYRDALKRGEKEVVLQTILPKFGFEIGEMEYDSSRKKPTVNKRIAESTKNGIKSIVMNYTEVPYNVNFNLTGYFRFMDDALQAAEQILPYFTPDFTVSIKQDVLGEENERMNIPIVLNSTGLVTDYEGAMELNPRIIMWNYNFTAKINLFKPLIDLGEGGDGGDGSGGGGGLIRFVEVNIFDSFPETF